MAEAADAAMTAFSTAIEAAIRDAALGEEVGKTGADSEKGSEAAREQMDARRSLLDQRFTDAIHRYNKTLDRSSGVTTRPVFLAECEVVDAEIRALTPAFTEFLRGEHWNDLAREDELLAEAERRLAEYDAVVARSESATEAMLRRTALENESKEKRAEIDAVPTELKSSRPLLKAFFSFSNLRSAAGMLSLDASNKELTPEAKIGLASQLEAAYQAEIDAAKEFLAALSSVPEEATAEMSPEEAGWRALLQKLESDGSVSLNPKAKQELQAIANARLAELKSMPGLSAKDRKQAEAVLRQIIAETKKPGLVKAGLIARRINQLLALIYPAAVAEEPPAAEAAPPEEPLTLEALQDPPTPPDSGVDNTPLENREALRKSLKDSFDDLAKSTGVEAARTDMQAKEAAYLAAYKALEKERGLKGGMSRLFSKKAKEAFAQQEADLVRLKQEFDESRAAYSAALEGAHTISDDDARAAHAQRMEERFARLKKSGALPKGSGGKPVTLAEYLERNKFEKFAEKHGKVENYLRFREIVRPLAEKKLQARYEALDERRFLALNKAFAWVAMKNQEFEKHVGGKNMARLIRIVVSATVITGGAAAFGGLAGAGMGAILGAGAFRMGRAGLGLIAGAIAGEGTGLAFEGLYRGGQKKAGKDLRKAGAELERLVFEDFARIDKERGKLALKADEVRFLKQKAVWRATAAVLVGAGTSFAFSELASAASVEAGISDAAKAPGSVPGNVPSGPGADAPAAEAAGSGNPSTPNAAPSAPAASPEAGPQGSSAGGPNASSSESGAASTAGTPGGAPSTPGETLKSVSIDKKGEGMAQMFVDLRESLKADPSLKVSPQLTELLSKNPNALTHELGAAADGKSITMQPGDQLIVDKDQNILLKQGTGEPKLLYKHEADGGYKADTEALKDAHKQPDGPVRPKVEVGNTPTSAPEDMVKFTPKEELPADGDYMKENLNTKLPYEYHTSENAPTTAEIAPPEVSPEEAAAIDAGAIGPAPEPAAPAAAPAPEAPRPSAPTPSESVPEATADRPQAEAAPEVFTNKHGIAIDPATPTVFVDDTGRQVAHGGTFDDRFNTAKKYALAHPGPMVLFDASYTDQLTGQRIAAVGGISSTPDGKLQIAPGSLTGPDGKPLPIPNTDTFIRKLNS